MSYIRPGHELDDFIGESDLYVFPSGEGKQVNVEDYDSDYSDSASLAQLIINMMRRLFVKEGFEDEVYIQKMIGVLSEKLKVEVRNENTNI